MKSLAERFLESNQSRFDEASNTLGSILAEFKVAKSASRLIANYKVGAKSDIVVKSKLKGPADGGSAYFFTNKEGKKVAIFKTYGDDINVFIDGENKYEIARLINGRTKTFGYINDNMNADGVRVLTEDTSLSKGTVQGVQGYPGGSSKIYLSPEDLTPDIMKQMTSAERTEVENALDRQKNDKYSTNSISVNETPNLLELQNQINARKSLKIRATNLIKTRQAGSFLENGLPELQDKIATHLGLKSLKLTATQMTDRRGKPTFEITSNELKNDPAMSAIGAILSTIKIASFNIWIDEDGRATSGSISYSYEHKNGGSNGMSICRFEFVDGKLTVNFV